MLSFPPRNLPQISPAGSSASTVADTSRLPAYHGPQSPIHSPIYDTNNLYRTLPYSRSQSPFTSPLGAPIRVPRQGGYVTIPRRPRQSWSASSEPPSSEIGDPLYDNLGVRTSASGHSELSLNKLAEASTPKAQTPIKPLCYDPIVEHDPPSTIATLPRGSVTPNALLNLSAMNRSKSPNQSSSTLPLIASNKKPTKTPPRPPPKPKKISQTRPLFEDEGEDGTEV